MALDLVFGQPVVEWVASRIWHFGSTDKCEGIGFASSGHIVAGAVFNNFRGHDVNIAFASDDPRWATRGNIRAVLHYPFEQLECVRITALTAKANKRSRKLLEGMGFVMEGVHPLGMDGKQTAISYGLLKENCKWLR